MGFCRIQEVDFSDDKDTKCPTSFLRDLAHNSSRPESSLKTLSAGITFLFEAIGQPSPMDNSDIQKLLTALIKTDTKKKNHGTDTAYANRAIC